MKYTLRRPSCTGCPHDLYFGEAIPKKQFGVMMHCGEHFCTGGKKARRFKRSDPKIAVPQWCPKRKSPCELRVYALKSIQDWHLHRLLPPDPDDPICISERRYALASSSKIELTPQEFWKRCQNEPCPMCEKGECSSQDSGLVCRTGVKNWLVDKAAQYLKDFSGKARE